VVSRDSAFVAEGARVARSLHEALALAGGADEVFIAGGQAIYREALPVADRVYLTRVHAAFEGDTVFPAFNASGWRVVVEERHEADEKNPYAHTFLIYERKP
jgi:dihydrofolate reductase